MAAATVADCARKAGRLGIRTGDISVDMAAVRTHIRRAIEVVSVNLSEARAGGLGVSVIKGDARFTGRDEVTVGTQTIRARRFVIATGAEPLIPEIPGLDQVPYFTEDTALTLEQLPQHLIVIGGEAAGIEIGQAFRRLGSGVTVIAATGILPSEDEESVAIIRGALQDDGIELIEQATVNVIERDQGGAAVSIFANGETQRIGGSHILINAARKPKLGSLNLEAAGIAIGPAGISVDLTLRTANPKIYAIGGCIGAGEAHVASDHATAVIRNALFRLPAKPAALPPHVVFTSPELARVGLNEADARRTVPDLTLLRWPFAENDRAHAEGATTGMVKVMATRKGRLVGVSMAGPHAGEMIGTWALAMQKGLTVGDVAETPMAYGTLSEVNGRVAHSAQMLRLFAPLTRGLVRLLARLDAPLRS
jgi:pyruvate/2-oxoglutarate dehydrogenase complex dihydrolipoamide dehydrogenase (E3) component